MDNREMEKKELNPEKLNQVAGGLSRRDARKTAGCRHINKTRTGNEKEDRFFIFWSIHKYEYHCADCGQNIWLSE